MPTRALIAKLKRILLITIGLIFLGLGILGYFVPGLPGTIWLILAASLFIRSSDRLYNFVVQNRLFGNRIKRFLETGAIPARAKILSVSSIWIFSLMSVCFAPYGLLFDVPIILLAITGTLYILTRPTEKTDVP